MKISKPSLTLPGASSMHINKEVRGEKWLKQITVSVSLFIPKPGTPFQWHPFADIGELKRN